MKTHMHIHRSRSRRAFTALLVSAALLVTSISTPCPAFAASGSSKSSLITVKTPSKEDIVKFMQEHPTGDIYFDEDGKSTGKTHETDYLTAPKTSAPYEAGRLAESEEAAALNTIKTIRYIAGISSNLYISEEYSRLAQASALVNYVNGKLTHTPALPASMDQALAAMTAHSILIFRGPPGAKTASNGRSLPVGWTTATRTISARSATAAGC